MNKKIIIILAIFILIIPSTLSQIIEGKTINGKDAKQIYYYDKGFRYNIQGWVYLHIEGDAYERGYQYGYLASAEIVDAFIRWANLAHDFDFMKLYIIKNRPENYDQLSEQWWEICRTKAMKLFYDKVPKEYQQEMKGMADALKDKNCEIFGRLIEFEDVVASQFVQEVWYGCFKYIAKRIHPVRDVLNIIINILTGEYKNQPIGHCNAFIATGDYTSHGGIVVAHSTVFNKNIAQRCNFVVDLQPTEGYRFTMSCPPGSLWSQEDYYQNEQGIVLTETELLPQGPFNIRKTPKGVRSRNAIQYSNSIDKVIEKLQENNNGLIPNEWLIGDTKTGEIASLEQAYYNTPIKRTNSGFYYSCNKVHNQKVKNELNGLIGKIYNFFNRNKQGIHEQKAERFIQQGEQYFGKIDSDIAKQILTEDTIIKGAMDAKITDSEMMENTGLLAFLGIPNGDTFYPDEELKKTYHQITDLPACGWVELYPSNSNPNKLGNTLEKSVKKTSAKVLWEHIIEGNAPYHDSHNSVSENIVITSISDNKITALDSKKGQELWNRKIDDKIYSQDFSGELIVVGTDKGVCAIDKITGEIKWYQYIGKTMNKPQIIDNIVVSSCTNGDFYAIDVNSGDIKWNYELPSSGEISEAQNNIICIGSGNSCYSLNVKTSEKKWEFITEGKITAQPKTNGKNAYFGSWDGNLYAVNLENGEEKWKYSTGWGIDTTPAVANGIVYFGSNDNYFYALDEEDGELVWFYNCNSAIHSSPAVYGDYVFFGSDDGRLYALDKTNGELAWDFTPEYSMDYNVVNNYITTPITTDPVVENNIVYISTQGNIYALDTQTIEEKNKKQDDSNGCLNIQIILLLLMIIGFVLLLFVFIKNKKDFN